MGLPVGPARAGLILLPGDIVVGDATGLWRIDPVTGAKAVFSNLGGMLDLEVDAQGHVYALAGNIVYRVQPQTYDANDPSANREKVWVSPDQCDGRGFDLLNDGTLLVACRGDRSIRRIDPFAYVPAIPGSNQTLVTRGGLIPANALQDVVLDSVLGVAYVTAAFVIAVDPAAFDPNNPGANQTFVDACQNGTLSIALDLERRLLFTTSLGAAGVIWRVDPSLPDCTIGPQYLQWNPAPFVVLWPLFGIAVENLGSVVVPERDANRIVRGFPATWDPQTGFISGQVVPAVGLLAPQAIAVAPEPAFALGQGAALAALVLLTRRRAA